MMKFKLLSGLLGFLALATVAFSAPAPVAAQAPPGLVNEINTNFPSCGTNCITATTLRTTLIDMLNAIYVFLIPTSQTFYEPSDLTYQGYIGDGITHPLSSITSYQGTNTTGWTLAQWKAVLPAATALTDEIDGDVINSLILKASGSVAFQFGPTSGRFSSPIVSCNQNVSIYGSGWQSSKFTFVNNTDAWHHCSQSTDPFTTTRVELQNFQFIAQSSGVAQYGFLGKFAPSNNMYFQNVQLNNFVNCIQERHGAGVYFNYVWCTSGQAAGTGTGIGIDIQGGNDDGQGGSFVNHFDNSLVQGFELGWRFYAIGVGLEDIRVHNSAAGGVRRCIQTTGDANAAGYSNFEYMFDNFSCDATTEGIEAVRAWHLVVHGGDWIIDPPQNALWTGVGADYFYLCRINTATLRDMFVTANAVSLTVNSVMRLHTEPTACGIPNPSQVNASQITNNTFEIANLTYTDALIAVDNGALAILIKDNNFTNLFVPTEPPVNAFRWSVSPLDNNSALFRNQNAGLTLGNNPGLQNITTNVVYTVAAETLAPGMWQCSGNVLFLANGATITVAQGAFSLAPSLPTAPGGGMFQHSESLTGSTPGIFPLATTVFDFSTATAVQTIYLVGVAQFSGSGAQSDGTMQCTRLR